MPLIFERENPPQLRSNVPFALDSQRAIEAASGADSLFQVGQIAQFILLQSLNSSYLIGRLRALNYTIYAKAVVFACEQHHGQQRVEGDEDVDYVVHPIRVAEHVRHFVGGGDVELLCAAVLHDTIEDSGTRYDEIAEAFGHRVARIVAELTNDSRLPKAERHEDMIRRAATMSLEAKITKLADRYDNLLSCTAGNKRRGLIEETPRLLAALDGACPALESAIRELLKRMEG